MWKWKQLGGRFSYAYLISRNGGIDPNKKIDTIYSNTTNTIKHNIILYTILYYIYVIHPTHNNQLHFL